MQKQDEQKGGNKNGVCGGWVTMKGRNVVKEMWALDKTVLFISDKWPILKYVF